MCEMPIAAEQSNYLYCRTSLTIELNLIIFC